MPFNFNSSAKALGLAALIATGATATAEEGVLSWDVGSSWKGSETPFKIKLGGKVAAQAFYFDHDDEYNRDEILRNYAAVFTTGTAQARYAAASTRWATTEESFSDGIEVSDVELWLKGSAYDNIIFGLKFEGAKSDSNVELDNWYMGVTGIPFLGTATIGEVDISWGIGEGNFYDDTVQFDAGLEDPDLVGISFSNEFYDGALGYTAVIGIPDAEYGDNDSNYTFEFELWGTPYEEDDTSVLLMASFFYHSPDSSAHNATSETWGLGAGLSSGAGLIDLSVPAENVTAIKLSGSLVLGAFGIGASVDFYDAEAPDADTLTTSLIADLADNGTFDGFTYTQSENSSFTAWQINAAYSLTGETQGHGGGITPKANFSWDGSGYGAFDIVARIAGADLEDDVRKNQTVVGSFDIDTLAAALISDASNRNEGGELFQAEIGLNWYLNPAMSLGVYVGQVNWSYDDDIITDEETSASAFVLNASSFTDLAGIATFVNQSSIENDYAVNTYYLSGSVKF